MLEAILKQIVDSNRRARDEADAKSRALTQAMISGSPDEFSRVASEILSKGEDDPVLGPDGTPEPMGGNGSNEGDRVEPEAAEEEPRS